MVYELRLRIRDTAWQGDYKKISLQVIGTPFAGSVADIEKTLFGQMIEFEITSYSFCVPGFAVLTFNA